MINSISFLFISFLFYLLSFPFFFSIWLGSICDAITNATVTIRAPILKHRCRPDICCAISLERGRISIECCQHTCRTHPCLPPFDPSRIFPLRLFRRFRHFGSQYERYTRRISSSFLSTATEFTQWTRKCPRALSLPLSADVPHRGRRNGINSDHEGRR